LALHQLGPFPSDRDDSSTVEQIEEIEHLLHAIAKPVSDEEAQLLLDCFGVDTCFGLAWTLLHLVETAPSLPVTAEPADGANEWIVLLWRRYQNSLAD
jgi:hypothetical protein